MTQNEIDPADEYWQAMRSPGGWDAHVRAHSAEFTGMSEFEGRLHAASLNWDVRVLSLDKNDWHTSDYVFGRVSLVIRQGRVVGVDPG